MKKKVLLIEDDNFVRENTAEILELANYNVEIAKNGKEGISKAKSFLPNIIICDILMPNLDGYGVLQIVSKTSGLEQIPFIFLTAKTHQNDLRKGMELGADDYICKPFEESELLRAIEVRLKRVEAFESKNKIPKFNNSSRFLDLKKIKNIDQYLGKKRVYHFKKDETIYCEGNQSNHIFLIKKGTVKTYKINEDGKEFNTGYYTNKQYFGYSSFVKKTPHFENSKAITETQLYKISKDEITSILNNNHHIIFDFIDLLSSNTIANNSQLMLLAYGSVRKKTAITLLNLLENYPEVKNNEIFITRLNLANSIGIAKETLTRTLYSFKEENLIDLSTKSLKVLNKEMLFKIS
ncbi:cAMP-binding domain of CRP or a regulatory subunit of cAMP-dependent protein kinases [Lutibacter agarilyticus]|uniref:cAMP-binding domain of CRP or a regulatory subunit of cAMP-dependent protein kinases n=1 Tax=Lutibacter agarilyticus TaxID=1109740 RepID=A0A238VIT0_9FLAO|nr:response regulator [Lutibacter agarilyticus]SNR34088.1 cAMP-binding domain of CRP or a regulatory subunit of cAMP-dependent protein kinases [Lutibacter agarilyticus]